MNIKVLKLADLNPAKYNPRKMLVPGDPEYEKLKKSIQNFGYVELIVVNQRTNNTVISGHQRLSVLKDLGVEEVECVVVDMDEATEKALNIAMNKISGEWDKDKLAVLITDLQAEDFDVSLTGFDAAELDELFKDQTKEGIHEDDFDVDTELKKPVFSKIGDIWKLGRHKLICGDSTKPETFEQKEGIHEDDFDVDTELKKPVFSKIGDIWKLGRHKLICGDSTKPETFEQLLLDQKVNLIVTDPPYCVSYNGKAGKIKNDSMKEDEFYDFLLAAFKNMHESMADDASIYVFHSDSHGLTFRKAFFDAGFYLSECCIWKKNRFVLGRSPYQWQHEPCLYGWKQKGKHAWYSDRKQSTIWEFDNPMKSKEHPTMKPVELCAYPIMNSSLTNSLVLDPFGGSGSTLIACEQTNRTCFMVELDEKFCDVIVNRYIEQAGSSENVVCIRDSGSTLIACEQTNRTCFMVELDEKFCDVIVNRYIEQAGSSENVVCIRDGLEYSYSEIVPQNQQN